MNSEVKKLIKELSRTYNGSPWLGNSLMSVLENIKEEKVFVHPLPNVNSIAGIVSHMIGWRKLLLRRLQGDDFFTVKQKETFNYKLYGEEPAVIWRNLLITLEENQQEIIRLLEEKEDEFLKERVAKKRFTFEYLINGIIQHDIYHMGQIAILKK